ncbi:hypothetical protein SLS57_002376 [Botryosphaeria dothidea]
MPSVFNPTASATISAPPEKVFALLIDRTTWPRWNTFIPRANLVPDPSSSPPSDSANDDGKLQLGQTLKFTVQARVFGSLRNVPGGSTEQVNILSTPDHVTGERGVWRLGWTQADKMMPRWLMKTHRVNEVVAEDGGGCTYRTYMTFEGPMAYVVKWLTGWMIQDGLIMWADDLKEEAEKDS